LRLDGIVAHICRCAQHRTDCVALGLCHARGEIRALKRAIELLEDPVAQHRVDPARGERVEKSARWTVGMAGGRRRRARSRR